MKYVIHKNGKVYNFTQRYKEVPVSVTGWHKCKSGLVVSGYYYVNLRVGRFSFKSKRVNRLVAKGYVPNPDNKPIVGHRDDNKLNNNSSNLYWCTHSENNVDAIVSGTRQTRLTDDEVREIRLKKESISKQTAKYKIDRKAIVDIRGRRAYSYVKDI